MKLRLNSFSLLEVALVLFLFSLLFTITASSIPQANQILNKIQSKLGFEEQMIIFFLQLEEDFFNSLDNNLKESLSFQGWEWEQSSNSFKKKEVAYVFRKPSKQISKKRNKEKNFTSFLQQVKSFDYSFFKKDDFLCLKVSLKSIFDESSRQQTFCRLI